MRRTSSRGFVVRRGGITPLALLSVGLLVGIAALTVDGGGLLEERRHLQAAADAAALAAATDLFSNYSTCKGLDTPGTAQASALATAQANGYANDGTQSIVTVRCSPQTYQGGPSAGQVIPAGYVEVTIQSYVSRTFSAVFGSGSIPVKARAVARGQWTTPSNNAVMALSLTAAPALSLTGNALVKVNGGLLVNSSSPSALNYTTQAAISATSMTLNQAAGTLTTALNSLLGASLSSTAVTYSSPSPDPLRFLPAPDPVQLGLTLQGTNFVCKGFSSADLYPGVYIGGITVSQFGSVTLHTNPDGSPGIYYLQGGGLHLSGNAVVKLASGETGGVMIYNDWQVSTDAISVSSQSSLTLTPPTSGAYQGMSIFQARGTASNPGPTINMAGSGVLNVTGTVYAPYASVLVVGSGNVTIMGGQVIADTLSLSGNGTIAIDKGSQPIASARVFGLVE